MEKGVPFQWTKVQEAAFMQLKSALVAAPVLTFPNVTKPFVLDTDAIGLGAVLSQIDDSDREHPVALASRSLSWTERRYSVTCR